MKLTRYTGRGYVFENSLCAVGKIFGRGYFVAFVYPFCESGYDVYKSKTNKPKFRNIMALSALFTLPWLAMLLVGIVWMALYVAYVVLGANNVVSAIKDSRKLGGFVNLVSIFCVTFFYLTGLAYVVCKLITLQW